MGFFLVSVSTRGRVPEAGVPSVPSAGAPAWLCRRVAGLRAVGTVGAPGTRDAVTVLSHCWVIFG